jgi:hypothetical protein
MVVSVMAPSMNDQDSLTEAQLATLTKLIDTRGERLAAQELGVGVDSLLRVLARRPNVRRGTIALLQRSLEQLATKAAQNV